MSILDFINCLDESILFYSIKITLLNIRVLETHGNYPFNEFHLIILFFYLIFKSLFVYHSELSVCCV